MTINELFSHYQQALLTQYSGQFTSQHYQALHAFLRCRTNASGQLKLHCGDCDHYQYNPMSCGHRHCATCQNHETSQWLDKQTAKLLPVSYFMVTFTLPFQYRQLAWQHQKVVYNALFECAIATLKEFGLNDKTLSGELAMTAVLHTHTRRLNYHPHCHIIIPGGAIDKKRRQWRKVKNKYLFNEFALAKVFRAKMIDALNKTKLILPLAAPKKWVVDCRHVGKGKPALKYLSRYLYRGVLSNKAIKSHRNGLVIFEYIDSDTNKVAQRKLTGAAFCWHILQHVLPKGFRRVRDYGFVHDNAKKWLGLIQLLLHMIITPVIPRERPSFICPVCQGKMDIVAFIPKRQRTTKVVSNLSA